MDFLILGPLEAQCEIAARRAHWDEAPELVAAARAETSVGEQRSLALFADRLEGLAAAAAGDVVQAEELLGRSAEGFAAIGARWEEARTRLMLADAGALPVLEQLGSVREIEQARALRY